MDSVEEDKKEEEFFVGNIPEPKGLKKEHYIQFNADPLAEDVKAGKFTPDINRAIS